MKQLALVVMLLAFPEISWGATATANLAITITGAAPPTYTYDLFTGNCTPSNGASATNCHSAQITAASCNGSTATNDAALQAFNLDAMRHTRPPNLTGPSMWQYAGGSIGSYASPTWTGVNNAYPDAAETNQIVLNIAACNKLQYTFNLWTAQLRHVKVVGAGSGSTMVQMDANNGANTFSAALLANYDYFGDRFYGTTINPPATSSYGHLIQTASAGATSVTLTVPADNTDFYVGRWVYIGSYVQDSDGYSPNMRYYDWAKVTGINSGTGVISLDPTTMYNGTGLRFTHLGCTAVSGCVARPYQGTTLTDAMTSDVLGNGQLGPARIIPIDPPIKPVQESLEIDGIRFLFNPTISTTPPGGCATYDGPQIGGQIDVVMSDVKIDCTLIDNQARSFTLNNSSWNFDESDKSIGLYTMNNTNAPNSRYHSGQLNWHVSGGTLGIGNLADVSDGNDVSCAALNCLFDNGVVMQQSLSTTSFNSALGGDTPNQTQSITYNGVHVKGSGQTGNVWINSADTATGAITLGSAGTSFSGNRITVSKCVATGVSCDDLGSQAAPSSAGYHVVNGWGDGATLIKNHNLVAGVTVTNITGDSSNVYVDFSGTPAFANGQTISVSRILSVSVTGSDSVGTGNSCVPASGPNNCLRYPTDTNIPTVTWSGNSGT